MLLLALFSLFTRGCGWGSPTQAPTQIPPQAFTQAAQTLAPQLTQTVAAADRATQAAHLALTPEPATQIPTETQPVVSTEPSAVEPTPTPDLDLTDSPTLAFFDDFSTDSGWFVRTSANYDVVFAEGGYRILVKIPETPIWSTRLRDYADIYLAVDVSLLAGPPDGYFGLTCRQQDGGAFYALLVGADGWYGIARRENGIFTFLQEGVDQAGVIKSGGAVNRLGAECVGGSLSLFVNGERLATVMDDRFASGNIGLIVGTRREPGVDVLFDNFGAVVP